MLVVFVVGFFAVIIVLNLILPRLSPLRRSGYRAEVRPPAGDSSHRFDPQRSWHGRGGVRVGRMNATYPLARIDIDASCASIRSPFGTITIDRTDVTGVRVIGMISPGIRFDSVDGRYDGLIFWTFATSEVLSQFHRFGWPVVGHGGATGSAGLPGLPPPPASPAGLVRPTPAPPPPPIPISNLPPGPVTGPGTVSPTGSEPRVRSLLRTGQYIGHYLAAGMVAVCLAVLGASFVPSLRGYVDMADLGFAMFPLVFALFALSLLSLQDTPRARRPYRSRWFLQGFPFPESWPRRLLVIGVVLAGIFSFFTSFAGPWTSPRHVDGGYTVDWNGATVPATEERYEQVRAAEQRPFLIVVLVFSTLSYSVLAEVDTRADEDAEGPTDGGRP